jgi:hypothetical protein
VFHIISLFHPFLMSPPQTPLTRSPPIVIPKRAIPPDGIIDKDVFEQVLELGEDDPSFLREMVGAYFDQAANTFRDMDAALCVFFIIGPIFHRRLLTDVFFFGSAY